VAFLSAAGGGKTVRMRNARLQPLSVIEADVNFRETRSLQTLGSFIPYMIWRDIYFNPVKSAVAIFITEFLNRFLRDSSPEPLLWDYVVKSVSELDKGRGVQANFHLSFLIGFLEFSGIYPDITDYEKGDFFDMLSGTMSAERPLHRNFLTPEETSLMGLMLRMNTRNCRFYRFTAAQRRVLLDRLLHYYSVHFPGMSALKSPAVLADVFS